MTTSREKAVRDILTISDTYIRELTKRMGELDPNWHARTQIMVLNAAQFAADLDQAYDLAISLRKELQNNVVVPLVKMTTNDNEPPKVEVGKSPAPKKGSKMFTRLWLDLHNDDVEDPNPSRPGPRAV